MKIQNKFLLTALISIIALIITSLICYVTASSIINKLIVQELRSVADKAHMSIDVAYTSSINQQKVAISVVTSFFENHVEIDQNDVKNITVTNQMTNEPSTISLPTMKYKGENLFNKSEPVDTIAKMLMENITIFQFIDKGILRISTTIKNNAGERAIGTFIPTSSPVYQTVARGEEYYGRAIVVGVWNVAVYKPLYDKHKKMIGVLFAGLPETYLTEVTKELLKTPIGKTGYVFIVDDVGKVVAHPTLPPGKDLSDITDYDGKQFIKDMLKDRNGIKSYPWLDQGASYPRPKTAVYQTHGQLNWLIAASSYDDEFTAALDNMKITTTITLFVTLIIVAVSLIATNKDLKATIGILNKQIGILKTASSEISKGNDDLASRTQKQAASLEEAASTLEEITSSLKSMTDYTSKAHDLSVSAVTSAQSGVDGSNQTLQAMHEISASSSKIAEIVSLVEEIAFQTNILAINAAIEAAKAGDLGKGFAVVAIEVRDLAQRTANATLDIKNLILTSIDRVKNGDQLVKNNNQTLIEISQSFQNVADLIKEISASMKEQYTAVENINQAVMEIDNNTQQNAGLVEEVSAASNNMNSEVQQIVNKLEDKFGRV